MNGNEYSPLSRRELLFIGPILQGELDGLKKMKAGGQGNRVIDVGIEWLEEIIDKLPKNMS